MTSTLKVCAVVVSLTKLMIWLETRKTRNLHSALEKFTLNKQLDPY